MTETITENEDRDLVLRMELEDLIKEYGEAAVTIMASDMYFELHPDEDEDTDETSALPEAPAADAAAVPAAATTATGTASTKGAAAPAVVSGGYKPATPLKFWALYTARKNAAPYRTSFDTDQAAKDFLADGIAAGTIKSEVCILTPAKRVIVHKAGAETSYAAGLRLYDSLLARHTVAVTIPVDVPKTKYTYTAPAASTGKPLVPTTPHADGKGVSVVKSASASAAVFTSTPPEVLR